MNGFRRRAATAITAVVAALTGALTVTAAPSAGAATGCAVTYRITNQWTGGFGADVTVTNLGDPINDWTLTWAFSAGQSVTQAWNATVTQTGANVTAKNVDYNRTIPANGSVNFGFNGSWSSANPAPTSFALNGATCTGELTGSPSASPTRTPSPSPSASPTRSPSPSPSPSTSPAPGNITVWLAGDSTVANSSGAPIVGWGHELGQYLTTNATVANNAVGGRSIQTWLYESAVTSTKNSNGECVLSSNTYAARWQSMLNASSGMKAGDYLFIQFGINDGDTACPRHVGSARFRELLTTMVRTAQQRGANPVLVTPVAALTCSGSTATPNRGYVTETFDVGAATGAPVIDLHKLSYTLYNSLHFCPYSGDYTSGPVGAFFANDHTHFETTGARQIAGLVAGAVRDQRLGLAAYLR
ncbi:cellulose binding domain-containing protein [Microbispora sp. RL4-1S]|uniref:Cellulose binding domain-containing protein n=1 Tax=Microbispora oryzae TaxID=2806554 RepID=A0A940WLC0_9ACTN|nr:cellulose binding domain-containing protein [Microbispora oryzae]MBP2705048.1 cellulose binding domain-containing protein [Microbispora oryzae]